MTFLNSNRHYGVAISNISPAALSSCCCRAFTWCLTVTLCSTLKPSRILGSCVAVAASAMPEVRLAGCACVWCAEAVLAMLAFALVPTLVLALLAMGCWWVSEGGPCGLGICWVPSDAERCKGGKPGRTGGGPSGPACDYCRSAASETGHVFGWHMQCSRSTQAE